MIGIGPENVANAPSFLVRARLDSVRWCGRRLSLVASGLCLPFWELTSAPDGTAVRC